MIRKLELEIASRALLLEPGGKVEEWVVAEFGRKLVDDGLMEFILGEV